MKGSPYRYGAGHEELEVAVERLGQKNILVVRKVDMDEADSQKT